MNGPPPLPQPPAAGSGPDELHALAGAVLDGGPGAADATDRWYRGEHPEVHRLCFGLLGGAAEADDQAQDAMLHLLDHLPEWDRRRPYRSWRTAVVLNLCRDRLRRASARARAETGAAELGLPDRLPDPESEAHRADVRRILGECLAALPEREREAFVLRDLEDVPTAEAAAVMGVRPASVRSLLTLARRRLRTLLGERLPEAPA